jgi:hypothetical protein
MLAKACTRYRAAHMRLKLASIALSSAIAGAFGSYSSISIVGLGGYDPFRMSDFLPLVLVVAAPLLIFADRTKNVVAGVLFILGGGILLTNVHAHWLCLFAVGCGMFGLILFVKIYLAFFRHVVQWLERDATRDE